MLGFINQLTKPPPNRLPSSSLPYLHLLDLLGDHTPVALVIVAVADAEPLHLVDQPLQFDAGEIWTLRLSQEDKK